MDFTTFVLLNSLKPGELLTINSIGVALIVFSLSSRLTYLISSDYHSNQSIRELAYPTVVLINRISYWGVFFAISIIIQLFTFLTPLQAHDKVLLFYIASLFTVFAFSTFLFFYIKYIIGIGTRFREWRLFNRWLN